MKTTGTLSSATGWEGGGAVGGAVGGASVSVSRRPELSSSSTLRSLGFWGREGRRKRDDATLYTP